jgi:hypothetical protein
VSSGTLKIYVPLEDAGMLPEAERRIRQQTFEALQEAGVTAPDIETDAAPGGVIDESEEVLGWGEHNSTDALCGDQGSSRNKNQ